jgi:zinc protease
MKKIISIAILTFMAIFTLQAQLDRSVRPQPGPAPEIRLGKFESFTLDNGLQVIVVENRKVPVVTYQLTVDMDPILEGDAKGFVDFAGQLMREGTTQRTKQQIDEAVDFIGASLSTYSTGIYASSLTRHQNTLLELMADVLMNPTFPEDELHKRINQTRSGLQTIKTNGNAIAGNIATVLAYGPEHPYGEIITEESLNNINADLLRRFYNTYWKPNISYMVIVGDINVTEARKLMDQYFSNWRRGDVPRHTYPTPQPPQGRRVAVGERIGAVQSVVQVTHPVVLPVGHPDAIKVSVMNNILGGGVFSGRLMQTLRETKGYTYGARSSISTDKLVSRFTASTEVRNDVTDSTVVIILEEMNRLKDEPVTPEALQLVKNFSTGSFARSLEDPRTLAQFALNIKRFNLPENYYATYLERLNAVTVEDVQQVASKYVKPDNAIIVIAGNISEVPETLKQFSANGEVELFDAFGRTLQAQEVSEVPSDVSVHSVLNNYYNAIGGKESFRQMQDIMQVIEVPMMGQVAVIKQYMKAPNKLRVETVFGGMVVQTQIFDGNRLVMSGMMGKQEITEGPQFDAVRMQAIMNVEMNYEDHGIVKSLDGIAEVEGARAYKVKVVSPTGQTSYEYYDVNTGLKVKSESEMGVAHFYDYQPEVIKREGKRPGFFARIFGRKAPLQDYTLMFPRKIHQQIGGQNLEMTVTEVVVNGGIEDSMFVPE